MHLVLMRHAEPARSASGDPQLDPPLSERGASHARAAARWVADHLPCEAVWSSPLQRAQLTASPAAALLGLPVRVDADLAEFDRDSPYLHFEDGAQIWQRYLAGDLSPWGTSLAEFSTRVDGVVRRIVHEHPRGTVLAVCHGGVINAWTCRVLGVPDRVRAFAPDYAGLSEFHYDGSRWRVVSLNVDPLTSRGHSTAK